MGSKEEKPKQKLTRQINNWKDDMIHTFSSNDDDEAKLIGGSRAGNRERDEGTLKTNQPRRNKFFASRHNENSGYNEHDILNLYKRNDDNEKKCSQDRSVTHAGAGESSRTNRKSSLLNNSLPTPVRSENDETTNNARKREEEEGRHNKTFSFYTASEDTEDDTPLIRSENRITSASSKIASFSSKELSSGDVISTKSNSTVGESSKMRRSTPRNNFSFSNTKDITPIKTDTFYGSKASTPRSHSPLFRPEARRSSRIVSNRNLLLSPKGEKNREKWSTSQVDVSDSDSDLDVPLHVNREPTPPPLVSQHVSEVRVSCEVMEVCWVHALSNEKQEIMGMLIGDIQEKVVNIRSLKVGKRSTKESLRVEVDSSELIEAMEVASALHNSDGSELRVIGWYHSHPHVTVLPSHVDIRTQAGYQTMDNQFVGLIFSVFWSDKANKIDQREVLAFQSGDLEEDGSRPMIQIPIVIDSALSRINKAVFVSVYTAKSDTFNKLAEEEIEEYQKYKSSNIQDKVTEMHNEAQLAIRLANIHKFMVEPICKELDFKLKIAASSSVQKAEKLKPSETSCPEMNENKSADAKKTIPDSVHKSSSPLRSQQRNVLKRIENSPRSSNSEQHLPSSKRVKTDPVKVEAKVQSLKVEASSKNDIVKEDISCDRDGDILDDSSDERRLASNKSYTYTNSPEF